MREREPVEPAPEPAPEPVALREPSTGRAVLLAPGRRRRPKLSGVDASAAACPFCPGAEAQTLPERDAVRPPETAADQPGWRVRAFANKYPASPIHEVVVEGPEHHERPAALGPGLWADVVRVWQRRIAAIEATPEVACAFVFKNVGARAGASIVHSHSQVIGLAELPPRLQLERDQARAAAACPWCAALATAEADERLILRERGLAILAPTVPRLAHETWLLPTDCASAFEAADPDALGWMLDQLFVRVDRQLGEPPLNLWLHRLPASVDPSPGLHWHFELQPRFGSLAGLELGAELTINSVPPAESAARLRG